MESSSSLHIDAAEANTNVTPSLDEQGSTGVKRSRITRSPIMQYFKLMHDRTYSCEICWQKYPDGMQGVIKRPTDGSTLKLCIEGYMMQLRDLAMLMAANNA